MWKMNGRNSFTMDNLTDDEKVLLQEKFAKFPRLPAESNNVCPNLYNPYHDPRECPGACRNCLWDGILREMGL